MRVASAYTLSLFVALFYLDTVQSLNILGIFPYQGKSHFYVFQPYLKELATRGHNVTIISYFPQKTQVKNYHDISLADKTEILENALPMLEYTTYWNLIQMTLFLFHFASENCKMLLGDEKVQNLWKNQNKFDLVVVEQFNSDCALGVAYKVGAPVVGVTSHTLMPFHHDRYGIPFNPSYKHIQYYGGGTKPSLYQRVERAVLYTYLKYLYKYLGQRTDENTLSQYFDDVPPLENLANEIKFILLYQHYTFAGSELLPPNVKEVGGFHIAKPKPLPEVSKKNKR